VSRRASTRRLPRNGDFSCAENYLLENGILIDPADRQLDPGKMTRRE
jgi:hypothetical protein